MVKKFLVGLMSIFVCSNSSYAGSYSVGQVWSYKTRLGEESSKVVIVKIEMDKKQKKIFHIYVDGLNIKNPNMAGAIQNQLPHAPISEEALNDSVLQLIEVRKELPDYKEGYGVWKEAFDKGEGGVFTIPVSKIVQYIDDIVNGKNDNKK